ncbi:ORF2 [Ranid herpesvirus 2]|uniref:ORF2 n=1 Tax=Ranid herpesvirus 2 TaxID=389214 RepID=Q14WA4_9VIRU|nr:ORF2 [Ranid herpesvirus 2]ABG25561.1 ORF2 [Ranid herpesvirus 2]
MYSTLTLLLLLPVVHAHNAGVVRIHEKVQLCGNPILRLFLGDTYVGEMKRSETARKDYDTHGQLMQRMMQKESLDDDDPNWSFEFSDAKIAALYSPDAVKELVEVLRRQAKDSLFIFSQEGENDYMVRASTCIPPHPTMHVRSHVNFFNTPTGRANLNKELDGSEKLPLEEVCERLIKTLVINTTAGRVTYTPVVNTSVLDAVDRKYMLTCKAAGFGSEDIRMVWRVPENFEGLQLETSVTPYLENKTGSYEKTIRLFSEMQAVRLISCEVTYKNVTVLHSFQKKNWKNKFACPHMKHTKTYPRSVVQKYIDSSDVSVFDCSAALNCQVSNEDGYSCKVSDEEDTAYVNAVYDNWASVWIG